MPPWIVLSGCSQEIPGTICLAKAGTAIIATTNARIDPATRVAQARVGRLHLFVDHGPVAGLGLIAGGGIRCHGGKKNTCLA
ncbi:hypothetical protein [Paracoccus sp. Ld10]|uniref:hypothetical protein n=1 Tax=Paracoccus sp. Ld10 TaxID=649158 RepID=UPI00386E9FF4